MENTEDTSFSCEDVPILLVTANVGSIFEDPDVLLPSWMKEFLRTVRKVQPKFLALHCQEVGGKNYEESMQHVAHFVRSLIESEELSEFIHIKIFLDEDFTSTAKFTALGNLYFIHCSITDCQIWNFKEKIFLPASGRDIFTGDIEDAPLKEKDKFPQEFFPECKWSRKGFLRTRWKLSGVPFDLINIHLFHDASNFTAMEKFPSSYACIRQNALKHTLDRIMSDENCVPFFLFGDFNFRLNTGAVIKKITNDVIPDPVTHEEKGHVERLLFKNSNDPDPSKIVLTVEKKVFSLINHEDVFYQTQNHSWLLKLDNELDKFKERVFEFDITFPPSYPFTEDACGTTYMKTRCPAWCDRILLSHSAKDIIQSGYNHNSHPSPLYQMMGADVPMGDHKPILLYIRLKSGKNSSLTTAATAYDAPCIEEKGKTAHQLRYLYRTNSNPSDFNRPVPKTETRRVSYFLPQEITRPDAVHSSAWLNRTQELLRNLRLKSENPPYSAPVIPASKRHHRHQLTRLSSRLTSHHSSSDEEWYEELNLLPAIEGESVEHTETPVESSSESEPSPSPPALSEPTSSPLALSEPTLPNTIEPKVSDVIVDSITPLVNRENLNTTVLTESDAVPPNRNEHEDTKANHKCCPNSCVLS